MKYRYLFLASLCLLTSPVNARSVWHEGMFRDPDEICIFPAQRHFEAGAAAFDARCWKEASRHFRAITCNYADTEYGPDSAFYLGVCEYYLKEYEDANRILNCYLKHRCNADHFMETMEYKLRIADAFKAGAKRRIFNDGCWPKWSCAYGLALEMYDEIVMAIPNNDIAARALYSKAELLWYTKHLRESIDTFNMYIRRFPKHEMTPCAYLNILYIYFDIARAEYQNPDVLPFAQLTLRKFQAHFPREPRLCEAEGIVMSIKEENAHGQLALGTFYERMCKPYAAAIYYANLIQQYPDTNCAAAARCYLNELGYVLKSPCANQTVDAAGDIIDMDSIDQDFQFMQPDEEFNEDAEPINYGNEPLPYNDVGQDFTLPENNEEPSKEEPSSTDALNETQEFNTPESSGTTENAPEINEESVSEITGQ